MRMVKKESFGRRHGPVIAAVLFMLTLGFLGYRLLHGLGAGGLPPPPKVQEISLVQPPPPPPPPPKVEEPPPKEEVSVPEQKADPVPDKAAADDTPPSEDLGLDAEGVAGSDGFGLAAHKGGRGIIGGGDRNRWYAGLFQRDLQDRLANDDAARGAKYAVVAKIWIKEDGSVEKFELVGSAGNPKIDAALARALAALHMTEARPKDMPQPLKLRVASR